MSTAKGRRRAGWAGTRREMGKKEREKERDGEIYGKGTSSYRGKIKANKDRALIEQARTRRKHSQSVNSTNVYQNDETRL